MTISVSKLVQQKFHPVKVQTESRGSELGRPSSSYLYGLIGKAWAQDARLHWLLGMLGQQATLRPTVAGDAVLTKAKQDSRPTISEMILAWFAYYIEY